MKYDPPYGYKEHNEKSKIYSGPRISYILWITLKLAKVKV